MRLLILLAILASTPAIAQIYKCSDESGDVTYSMTPCPNRGAETTVMGTPSATTKYYKCADKSGKYKYRLSYCLNTETVIAERSISGRERKNTLNNERFWAGNCSLTDYYAGTSRYTGWCEVQVYYREARSGEHKKLRVSYPVKNMVVNDARICELYAPGSHDRKLCSEVAYDKFIEHCERLTPKYDPLLKEMYCDIASRFKPSK